MTRQQKNAHTFERAEYEWYSEGPSCADALFACQPFDGAIHDPCAGMGNVVRAALAHGFDATASDINPRPEFFKTIPGVLNEKPIDFCRRPEEAGILDNIVMNPPYGAGADGEQRKEEAMIDAALSVAGGKVAALLRLQWIVARKDWCSKRGLLRVWLVTPRPSILPGANIVAGEMPGGGSVDYAWFVFLRDFDGSPTILHADRDPALDKPEAWTWRKGE